MVGGLRRFDLYDFFSVFVPGTTFIIGLFPFLPKNADITAIGAIVPAIVAGYVVGRGFHSLAAWIDGLLGDTHRTRFFEQLTKTEPSDFTDRARRELLERCERQFGVVDASTDPETLDPNDTGIQSMYTSVRSLIHIDGRGRSRTFQAVYAFHRSMWVIVVALGVLYVGYGLVRIHSSTSGIVAFQSIVRGVDLDPFVLLLIVMTGLSVSFATFRRSKRTYRKHFVEYLVTDFLAITDREESSTDGRSLERDESTEHHCYDGAFSSKRPDS